MMQSLQLLVILLLEMISVKTVKTAQQIVLSTAQGLLRGMPQEGYISYVGVPYASVLGTTGRFKRAGIAPTWSGIREPRDPQCSATSAAEDCLQLDVHAPLGTRLPVLVWIKGSSGYYHPGQLIAQGIVVVVVRHRLGPLGFLCSKADKIPGNAGLKDALQALRWVRDNIVAFNGNPHRVIVGGQGFGAAMVEALTLLPSSRELYHGVILQSGTILCPWTFNQDAEERANALRKMLNGTDDATPSLTKSDPVTLGTKAEDIEFPYLPFGMCVEKPYKNEESIFLQSPHNLMLNGKMTSVPVLMGYNNNEGYIFASMLKEAKVTRKIMRDMTFLLPEELQSSSEREELKMTRQFKDMYFGENMNMSAVLAYYRDAYFLAHIYRSLRFHAASQQPVYFYQFSYSGNNGVLEEPGVRKRGAAHSDELAYLFPQNGRDLEEEDGVIQQHLITLWTNFVKHLNPTPEVSTTKWEPTSASHPRMLDIDTELEMQEFPHTQAMYMWENMFDKYHYTRNM